MRSLFFVLLIVNLALSAHADEVSFAKDVWPIFRQHCWSCHSGDKPQGALRLDAESHLRKGGENGPIVVPGKPDESSLIEQVSGDKPAMPPKQPPLGEAKVAILRRWIAAGAKIDSMPVDATATVKIPATYDYAPSITSVAYHPDGLRVACACRSEVVIVSLVDETPPIRLATGSDLVTFVEFSPDGKLLAAAGGTPAQFGELTVFDVDKKQPIAKRRLSGDTLFRGGFSPDGKQVALGSTEGAVYLVPVDEQAKLRRLELHSDWCVDVAWTVDGTKLITAGRDKTTKVASVESGELLRTIDTALERINAVVADANLAVSAGLARGMTGYTLNVALQNVEVTGSGNGARPVSRRDQYVRAFEAPPGEVLDLAVSGDRKVLAAAGRFGDIRIFTLADQRRTGAVAGVAQPVFAIALNRDGTQLVVGGKSGKLDVYELPAGKLLKSLAPVPVKNVTQAAVSR